MNAAAYLAPRTAVGALRALQVLLAPDGAWAPGYRFGARDAENRWTSRHAAEAVRWGVLAGLCRVCGSDDLRLQAHALLCRAVAADFFVKWEDAPGRTQAEVLAAIDRAVELARAEDRR